MQSTSFLESLVLKDVQEKTGPTFRKLDGIRTRDKSIAEAVLPVLSQLGWEVGRQSAPSRHLRLFSHISCLSIPGQAHL